MSPSNILIEDEIKKWRTPEELAHWVDEKISLFETTKETKKYYRKGSRLTKKFREEIVPFRFFINNLYPGRTDIKCIPNLGNENYDAIIQNYSVRPTSELKVEFTYAIDGYDLSLRLEVLHENGIVSLTDQINKDTGTKNKGRKIEFKSEADKDSEEVLFDLIKKRAEEKCHGIYGNNHILVIIFSDNFLLFSDDKDPNALSRPGEFLNKEIATLPLDFQRVYVSEFSGRVLLPIGLLFPIFGHQDT
jgi:hypothetical protein